MTRLITLLAVAVMPVAAWAQSASYRLEFTGDIMLSRQVRHEIAAHPGRSPWRDMAPFLRGADWVMGNLEGAVGKMDDCIGPDKNLCFATEAADLPAMRQAGFTALGIDNNHSADLGAAGRRATYDAVAKAGLVPMNIADSPVFLRLGPYTLAFVTFSNVAGQDHGQTAIPSVVLRQKLRLARALADWVVVFVHWGAELSDWPQPAQIGKAKWLVAQGADLIIGAHPHVVQAPACVDGRPVFYSLGNHVFDQKYPETKQGMIADCHIDHGKLACQGAMTETGAWSSFPALAGPPAPIPALAQCQVAARPALTVNGFGVRPRIDDRQTMHGALVLSGSHAGKVAWTAGPMRLLSLDHGYLNAADPAHDYLVALEDHLSDMDDEMGPRPYVYDVAPSGLIARWRGSALAWPLVDAALLKSPDGNGDFLCALHRRDSFLVLNAQSRATRMAAYRWNGFGFTGLPAGAQAGACAAWYAADG